MSQNQQVFDYMQEHGSIDPFRAFTELGIFRLAARVSDLRASEIPVIREMQTRTTQDGTVKRWAEYRLGVR